MTQSSDNVVEFPSESSGDVLTEILRKGARNLLAGAIEQEVTDYLRERADLRDEAGRQLVVRNGYLPERRVQTGLGDVPVKKPRVRDRRPADAQEVFDSSILPRYLRRTKSMEELLPWLYLKGISTNDFSAALAALLGPDAQGLSATTITRLKTAWEQEYRDWSTRSLAGQRYAYVWADGVYFNVRLEDAANARQCILVLMGATPEGRKELIAVSDGYRESEQSWRELLLSVRGPGTGTGAQARGRRWRARLLGGPAPGVLLRPRAALLGSQDRERAQQNAAVDPAQGQVDAPRDLDGGDQGRRGAGLRFVPRDVQPQVSRRHDVPRERPGRVANLL